MWDKVKKFGSDISPSPGFMSMINDERKGLLPKSAKNSLLAMSYAPLGAGVVGAAYGASQGGEAEMAKGGDLGFQVGGVIAAGAMVSNKYMRGKFGYGALGAIIGGAGSTITTAAMQDDDASAIQRFGVNFASLVAGSAAGGGVGLAVSKFSKPLTKVV